MKIDNAYRWARNALCFEKKKHILQLQYNWIILKPKIVQKIKV